MNHRTRAATITAISLVVLATPLLLPLGPALGGAGGRKSPIANKSAQPKGLKAEHGMLILPLKFPKGVLSEDIGAITLRYTSAVTERPGDFTLGGWTPGTNSYQTILCSGVGSEIRFRGKVDLDSITVVAPFPEPLCVRKVANGWAYVCGRGRVVFGDAVTSVTVGEERSASECMRLLESNRAVLREGGARDLGRLVREPDRVRAVRALKTLLADSSSYVRCGAAEGLALAGGAESFAALKTACAAVPEHTPERDCMAYWLAVCGGLALVGSDAESNHIAPLDAARGFLGDSAAGTQKWAMYSFASDAISDVIADGRAWSFDSLSGWLSSEIPDIRLAAARLAGSLRLRDVRRARQQLEIIADSDKDDRIRQAAKEALGSMVRDPLHGDS